MAVIAIGSGIWSIQDLPAVGEANPVAIQQIIDFCTTVRDSLERLVDYDSIHLSGDLEMNTHGIIEIGSLQLESLGASLTGGSHARKLYAVGNDLYYTSGAGSAVKITNGGSLNLAATGALTGDYGGADPAQLRYDTTNDRYGFYSNYASDYFGEIKTGDILLAKKNVASSNTITLKVPAGLATNYTWTLPSTLPGSTSMVSVDSSGNLSHSATVSAATITTLTSTTISATTGNITNVSGTSVTVTEADVRHANATLQIGPEMMAATSSSTWVLDDADFGTEIVWKNSSGSGSLGKLYVPLPVKVGDRIQSVKLYIYLGSASSTITATLYLDNVTDATAPATKSSTVNAAASSGYQTLTISATTPAASVAGDHWYLYVTGSAGVNNKYVLGAEVVYDRP